MLHLPRRVWIKLAILGVVSVLSCGIMMSTYMQLPATLFGIGRYTVTLDLRAAGGLYPTSNVTYRGTQVGQVTQVRVTDSGVQAVLSLNSKLPIPSDVEAQVHSRTALGEQFIDFAPRSTTSRPLRNGDVIPVDHTQVPPDIAKLLDATNTAIQAIPPENLRTVVDEANTAVAGLGPELSRIVNGSTALAIEAGRTVDPITHLIDDAGPVLESQTQTSDSIAVWADRLAAITGQLKAQDSAVKDLLAQGGPAFEEGRQLFNRVAPALPVVLANLVSIGEIAVTYNRSVEQLLVLLPHAVAVTGAMMVPNKDTKQDYHGAYLDFQLNLNLPQTCTTGYLPATQRRSPSEVDYPDPPAGDVYCRVPQDAMMNVRGLRNIPCTTVPDKRAPTVAMCESDEQYVPLNDGQNWKGDPNATLSGQDVPELPPPTAYAPASPDAAPGDGASTPPPAAVTTYDPATGSYIGPDGRQYTQADLGPNGTPKTWQSLLLPPAKP